MRVLAWPSAIRALWSRSAPPPSKDGPAGRWSRAWLDVLAVVLAVAGLARLAAAAYQQAGADDFAHYYLAGELVRRGHNPYRVDLAPLYATHGFRLRAVVRQVHVPNPPLFVWLFAPLTILQPGPAYVVWVGVEVACLGLLGVLLWQLVGDRLSWRGWLWVAAASFTSDALLFQFGFAQLSLLLAVLVLAAFAWRERGRGYLACTAVTVAALLKLFPIVLVPWYVWRAKGTPRDRLRRGLWVVTVIVAAVLASGLNLWQSFFHDALLGLTEISLHVLKNFTVPALVTNLGLAAGGDTAGGWQSAWRILGVISGAAVLATAYRRCWRARRHDPEAEFCLLCAAMLVGQMTCWSHYLVFMIFPVTVAAVRVCRRGGPRSLLFLITVLVLLNGSYVWGGGWWDEHQVIEFLVNDAPLYGVLAVAMIFWGQLGEA